jgi:hypothetical protein
VRTRWLVGGFALATLMYSASPSAQRGRPLSPLPPIGQRVVPFFDGWYGNSDGTITFSFGYSNLNREEVVTIPLGPDNFIEPKEYDGGQPIFFPPAIPDAPEGGARGGGAGSPADRRDRERGVFTVTVPAGFKGTVVWTLRNRGQSYSVPASAKTGAYRLQWPMAMGSTPPLLRFDPGGKTGRGPVGIHAAPLQTRVGTPLPLKVWITDDSVREKDPVPIKERVPRPAMNVLWYAHSGPARVVFAPPKQPIAELEGTAATAATFTQPGEYLLRVRVDNFGRVDTSAGNQCCWTNGYMKVTVTP